MIWSKVAGLWKVSSTPTSRASSTSVVKVSLTCATTILPSAWILSHALSSRDMSGVKPAILGSDAISFPNSIASTTLLLPSYSASILSNIFSPLSCFLLLGECECALWVSPVAGFDELEPVDVVVVVPTGADDEITAGYFKRILECFDSFILR